jgi:uncharacterized lipoprotein NlpE involved in copper resistance
MKSVVTTLAVLVLALAGCGSEQPNLQEGEYDGSYQYIADNAYDFAVQLDDGFSDPEEVANACLSTGYIEYESHPGTITEENKNSANAWHAGCRAAINDIRANRGESSGR